MLPLSNINQLDEDSFTKLLGGVFEHSPWIAEQVFILRPFNSVESLHQAMLTVVNQSSEKQRLILICNHPELAGKEAEQGNLTTESKNEQARAGLQNCSAEEIKRLRQLNLQYREKFGFPFVIAVKNLTRHGILNAMKQRLNNSSEQEFETCIHEIGKIGWLRLNDLIQN